MSSPPACVWLGVGKGPGGNREVSPRVLLGMRGDLSGARIEELAVAQEEAVAAPRG
jgi:hypothetical protein